jgi:hypothetical protein
MPKGDTMSFEFLKYFEKGGESAKKATSKKKEDFFAKCEQVLEGIRPLSEEKFHELQKVFHTRFHNANTPKKVLLGFHGQLVNSLKELQKMSPQVSKKIKKAVDKKTASVKAVKTMIEDKVKVVKKAAAKKVGKKKAAAKKAPAKAVKKATAAKKKVAKKVVAKKKLVKKAVKKAPAKKSKR